MTDRSGDISDAHEVQHLIEYLHDKYQTFTDGELATYIPELAKLAVVNRQLGIATYSPRLDGRGNSRRGIEVCVELAARLGLHAFGCMNFGSNLLNAVL
jgi:glutaminase